MDRFVWFVLLVVMSHLVTEFTRATGYTSGSRNDAQALNDSATQARQVQNLVLFPGQEYGYYQQPSSQYSSGGGGGGSNNNMQSHAPVVAGAPTDNSNNNNNQGGFIFSLRPLIDSIFEIPISTLRAVNDLVARLTGSFQQSPAKGGSSSAPSTVPRSATAAAATSGFQSTGDATPLKVIKRALLREESA